VIVGGQLVELAVLRERRMQRDAAPVRKLTMTLRTAATDELRVDAHVQDERLVVEFTGTGAADATSCAGHAEEVRALASRLGWTFTGMTWGVAK
jgi:hypothetical protein